ISMKTLLRIDVRKEGSYSRQIADYYQEKWEKKHTGGKVIIRDLADDPVPHLTQETIEAFQESENKPSPTELSESLIQELKSADQLLISSPLYNLALSSTLKAYFDYVTRFGLTFSAQQDGYIGLLSGKSAVVATAKGSVTPSGVTNDFLADYIKAILSFMGIKPIEIIGLEGTALKEAERSQYIAEAKQQTNRLIRNQEEPVWKGPFRKKTNGKLSPSVMDKLKLSQAEMRKLMQTFVRMIFSLWFPDMT
ncbi:NAD(P)H-dependent oxidoreductase, partial [bacterium]|nr:NAD(P)H-dependent oxidoreductase [bacterium]